MSTSDHHPLVYTLITKIAARLGIEASIYPELGYFGSLKSSSGLVRYMQGSSFDINPRSASEVANSKQATNLFLEKWGYTNIKGDSFILENGQTIEGCLQQALSYAKGIGFPLYVKPNSLSQGIGVAKVYDEAEFESAVRHILALDDRAIVQEAIVGRDYRLIVLDDKVICAYLRRPLTIIGDGHSTVEQLIVTRQAEVEAQGAKVSTEDKRIAASLARNNLDLDTILESDRELPLLDNANLSAGGTAVDMSDKAASRFKDLAVAITRDMGLRYAGVDLLIEPDISDENARYTVIELNAAPGLDNFASLGEDQLQVVEDHYEQIVKKMLDL